MHIGSGFIDARAQALTGCTGAPAASSGAPAASGGPPSDGPNARRSVTLSLSKGAPSSSLSPESVAAAVLFREILKPLARGLGPVGEIALGGVADALFTHAPR